MYVFLVQKKNNNTSKPKNKLMMHRDSDEL